MRYLLADHLGGTTVVTDDTGDVLAQRAYWPYGGERVVAGDQRLTARQYTGQREEDYDGLGLYNYKARFYSTTLGRFVSVDPLMIGAGSTQSLNSYAYVRNNPLSRIDPTGLADMKPPGPERFQCDTSCQWIESWKAYHPGRCWCPELRREVDPGHPGKLSKIPSRESHRCWPTAATRLMTFLGIGQTKSSKP